MFVHADPNKRIERLVIFQFESVRPGGKFKFVYPSKPPYAFGSAVYRVGTYVYDDAREAEAAPGRESDVTRKVLVKSGYIVPHVFRTARLARVSDPGGTTEVIIFYLENADAAYPSTPLHGADSDGDLVLRGQDAESLLRRLSSAISAVGQP